MSDNTTLPKGIVTIQDNVRLTAQVGWIATAMEHLCGVVSGLVDALSVLDPDNEALRESVNTTKYLLDIERKEMGRISDEIVRLEV